MISQEKSVPFLKNRKVTQLSQRMGIAGTSCVLDVMINDRSALIRDSAAFIVLLERIWKAREVDAGLVWSEINERIRLADELRASGIRPYKGGRFRSTKLP
ncbi:hypothetical protein GFJ39_04880 [Gluconobacter sp. AC10]|uniref:Uncharacterized protein n=2 Tax=Gluconobacter aidae TaxID=2662454 RepID=A0A7X1VPP7_9PROT|nr:hypothetical protein [Gluconobacter aidae]